MPAQEVPRETWVQFLDGFSGRYEGWLVNVEVISRDVGAQIEAESLPLRGISADLRNQEDSISIILGKTPDQHITHTIRGVSHLRVKKNETGADEALQIESADGTTSLLRFRTSVLPETVDGIMLD